MAKNWRKPSDWKRAWCSSATERSCFSIPLNISRTFAARYSRDSGDLLIRPKKVFRSPVMAATAMS